MQVFSIIYFISVTVMTGTLIDLTVKDWKADWLEKLIIRFGVGLAAFSVIGVILNLLRIPLDYRVFLLVAGTIFCGALFRNRSFCRVKFGFFNGCVLSRLKGKSFWYGLLLVVLFASTVYMYVSGAFNYAYFEDTDPWGYAAVADYIGESKTFSTPYYSVQYGEPYTQGYQIVMGVLSQTNDSIYWTMKFFSALVNSFGVLFMYFFALRFSGRDDVALLSAVFLFAVPAWVSHFVFSLHFNMTVFVVLLYVLAQLRQYALNGETLNRVAQTNPAISGARYFFIDRVGWVCLGAVVYASMLVNHFSSMFHASIFCLILITIRVLAEKKIDWHSITVFVAGSALSLLFFVPAYARHWWLTDTSLHSQHVGGIRPLLQFLHSLDTPSGLLTAGMILTGLFIVFRFRRNLQTALEAWLGVGKRGMYVWFCGLAFILVVLLLPFDLRMLGTGDQDFGLKHFFSASSINFINNPFGLGPVLMPALLASTLLAVMQFKRIFSQDDAWIVVSFSWAIAAFLMVIGKHLSIAIAPFRVWTFMGFFASLFAAWGIAFLVQKFTHNSHVVMGLIVVLILLLIPTTFLPKYRLNTMIWSDDTIGVQKSRKLFEWMRDGGIPKNSVVAHLCGDSEFLSGYDMNPPLWNEEFHPRRDFSKPYFVNHPLDLTPEAIDVLKKANVEYVTLGASCFWQAPTQAGQEENYGYRIRQKIDEYLVDPRLSLVENTDLEFLFKLK